MVEPARLPPGKLTEQYGQALAEEPWFGKAGEGWQRNGHKVPNEKKTPRWEIAE